MNATFFLLAFVAVLNPKLLALDLLLIENRRPRAMFLSVSPGGLTVGLTIGLLNVLVFHLDALGSQRTVSAGIDLTLGLLLLAVGALVATGRLHGRHKARRPRPPYRSRRPYRSQPTDSQASRASGRRTAGHSGWPSPGSGSPCSSAR